MGTMKTKILHLITGLNQGGAEAMLYKLLNTFDNSTFENVVVSMTDAGYFGDKISALGTRVYYLNMKPLLSLISAALYFRNIVKNEKPDIIQAWMYHANVFALISKPFLRTKKIVLNVRQSLDNLHNTKKTTRLVIKFNAKLSRFATRVINNSQRSLQQHQDIGFCKNNSTYIPNGFDLDVFQPNNKIYGEFRKKHKLPENSIIVGMIARFHPDKNHKGFVEIGKQLLEMLSEQTLYFVLAGPGCSTQNAELNLWIHQTNFAHKFILLNTQKSSELLPALDVYLSTSWVEGFPNVIGESMACGVPCVATDVGDCKAIIHNYGSVVTPGDYITLAEKVFASLNISRQDKQKIREHIAQHYRIKKITAEYEKLYLGILS
jgi:glycosyltransferase involved in cell wall biosynthesis